MVIDATDVEFGMLYEFMRMSWTAGIRSKKAVRVIGVFLLLACWEKKYRSRSIVLQHSLLR
jgi:hypothetical protein